VAACLALWDDEAAARRALSADEQAALAAIRTRIASSYRAAAPDLLDALGSYCAYCELPLHDPSQVEHVLPKSEYPTFALTWENFLSACIGCNSRKREKPLRSELDKHLGGPASPAAYEAHIRAGYRWPDEDDVDGFLDYELRRQDGSGWQLLGDAASVHRDVRHVSDSVVDGAVRADLDGHADVPVMVVVADAGGDARTRETIQLCGLDREIRPRDAADRRTLYRTLAWLDAVAELRALVDEGATELPRSVARLVTASGFYWVWLTVARRMDASGGLLTLVRDGLDLAGTDTRRLP
jgi:uncharacterized protein (TIGR02646 family)